MPHSDDAFAIWWEDFARHLARKQRSESTVRIYRQSYDYFTSFARARGLASPVEVTTAVLNRWIEHEQDKGIATNTVALRYRNLRPFFAWYAKEERVANPADGVDVPAEVVTPPPLLHTDDARAMVAACDGRDFTDVRDRAIIWVLWDTGVRLGELLAMDLDAWDRRTDTLRADGKTGLRYVDLSPSTGEVLSRYLRVRETHPKAARSKALWLGRKGPLGASGLSSMLERRARQAGIDHVHPHLFRHTFSHIFRLQGGSEGDLMQLAGWKSTAMAHRYGASAAAERARATHRAMAPGDMLDETG
jgi:site-specific recombinase XerC